MRMRGHWAAVAAVLAALMLSAAGCGGDEELSGAETAVATTDPAEPAAIEDEGEETTAPAITDEDCIELARFRALGAAVIGAIEQADYEATTAFFRELMETAPDEIKDDLATVAKAWGEVFTELNDVDLSPGSPETAAKLQALTAKFDTPALKQATANIDAWAAEHCGTTTP